jgi:hypothetical protein
VEVFSSKRKRRRGRCSGLMNFRNKVETILVPLVARLREKLARVPTLDVLNYYQHRINLVQTDKSKVPDGFMFKWRYLWALLLSGSFVKTRDDAAPEIEVIDGLIEEIFETYAAGAIYEPGRNPRSEKEFLARLGLGLRVREPDQLAFPDQIQKWASRRLQSFDASYLVPRYGLSSDEILAWMKRLIGAVEERLNACVRETAAMVADTKSMQSELAQGILTIGSERFENLRLEFGTRLERNARALEAIHVFSLDGLRCGIQPSAIEALLADFVIRPGEVGAQFSYPHDDNPLEHKIFVRLPDDQFFFLDPANAIRVLAKTLERDILSIDRLRDRYLKGRDRATERWVAELATTIFSSDDVFRNYFLEKGGHEKDLLIRHGDTVILVECKNSKVRPFRGGGDDLLKFQEDFKNSVQLSYEQALHVKRRILENDETTFLDEQGKPYFTIRRDEVKKFYIICVTVTPRGPFGTDLSYELKKGDDEPFPLALRLFDLDTICKHLNNPERFIAYLAAREGVHGRVQTGDELNFAGYFLKFGNLDLERGDPGHCQSADESLKTFSFLTDDFSSIFDRAWFKEQGIEVEEPHNPPAKVAMTKKGNRVHVNYGAGRSEVIRVPPHLVLRASGKPVLKMKGSDRNKPCPCGSGEKFKYCHGV